MDDTPQEVKDIFRQMMMARSGAERVSMAYQSFDDMKQMILASFSSGLSELETKRRLCERLYGNEVDVDAFVESLYARQKRREAEQGSTTVDYNASE
jgi:hypothetical protein